MGTKERLAEGLERLARLIPGVGSYQDKESLREGDKRLRDTLAERLDSARKAVEGVIDKLQRDGLLAGLDRLGRLERKLHQATDAIRFASRGYSGSFDAVKIDEEKLERLYAFDISLAELVSAVQAAAEGLKSAPPEALASDALESLITQIASFNYKLGERANLFKG